VDAVARECFDILGAVAIRIDRIVLQSDEIFPFLAEKAVKLA
jgi:hypothetical protein